MVIFTVNLLYCMVIMLGSMTFGCVLVYPSPAIPKIEKEFGWEHNNTELILFNSISSGFAIVGPYFCGFLLQYFGRRPVLGCFGILGVIFWTMLYFTQKSFFWYGIMCRALLGIVMGGVSTVSPMYIVEMSPPESTGFYGSLNQLGICCGIFSIYLAGNFLSWRNLALYGMSVDLLLSILIWFIPETDSTKITFGRNVKNKYQDFQLIPEAQGKKEKISLCQKRYIGRLVQGVMLFFFQQFCGCNAILTNMGTLLAEAHLDIPADLQSAIVGGSKVFIIIVGAFLIQTFGRKFVWILSYTGCTISLFVYAFSVNEKFEDKFPPWLGLILIFSFVAFYSIGAGPIPWFLISEMFDPSVRHIASSIITSSNWIFTFLVIETFEYLKSLLTFFGCMLLFTAVSLSAAIFGAIFIKKDSQMILNKDFLSISSNYDNTLKNSNT